MERAFAALRTLLYATGFIWLWGWLAFQARDWGRDRWVDAIPAWAPSVGLVLMVVGAAIDLACFAAFAFVGRGTPAPFDPPRELVPVGPYRFVRNPMYIGALIVLVGFALYERSVSALLFVLFAWLAAHLFVILGEEPVLERKFGESYLRYKASVRRWLPRIPRAVPKSSPLPS